MAGVEASLDDAHHDLRLRADERVFVLPATEAAFLEWHRMRTLDLSRGGLRSSLVALGLGAVAIVFLRPGSIWLPVALGLLAAVNLTVHTVVARPRWSRWYPTAVAVNNATAGWALVVIDGVYLGEPQAAAGVAVVGAFLIFAVHRTRPSFAMLGASSYLALAAALVARAMASGAVSTAAGVIVILLLAVAFGAGSRAARAIDRDTRLTYRQERIIDAQRETIARQQVLLERELSHQVAERSRELGAVLARSDVTLDVRRLAPGERFAERYNIISALGAGGMGAVYEVERVTDGARLALKAVVGEVSGSSAARFAREAEIGARVRHANLIAIVDVGVSAGVPFLAMELARDGSLEAQRARFGDIAWALPILRQIAEGLAALHDAGVVHRDLKPANVLLAEGVAKISDFGISRFGALDEGASIDASADTMAASPKPRSSELTGTGVVMGTPLYMAPEGAKSARALDSSADVFALGIIAYEMLTGRSPFAVPAFMLAMAEQPIPTPAPIDDPRVAPALATVLNDCFAGDPTKRPRVRVILAAAR